MDRMFSEKILAAWQGGLMAQYAAMTGAFAFWTSIISGKIPAEATRAYLDGICTAAWAPTRSEIRSEERRVGKECVSTCKYRWSRYRYIKKKSLLTRTH